MAGGGGCFQGIAMNRILGIIAAIAGLALSAPPPGLAQLGLVDGQAGAAYAHPFFWSPYALYGDPVP
jgi:hypothetical protein